MNRYPGFFQCLTLHNNMTNLTTLFFLGKGGTGKSTAAALVSLSLREKGKKVLLASFDDAHNQGDIFESEFSDNACTMGPCLEVLQVDRDRQIRRYLEKTAEKVKSSFRYLSAFNLDSYFDILKYSPGMEAYALASSFMALHSKYKDYDYLVADMPPTALSMRFFSLPELSLLWVDQLEKLRAEIYKRKEIISKIKFAGKTFERDRILKRIHEIQSEYKGLKSIFTDFEKTKVFAVFNPDRLSVSETRRIIDELDSLGIMPGGLLRNHRMNETSEPPSRENPFAAIPVQDIPYSEIPLIGMTTLENHIQSFHLNFDTLL